MKGKDYPASNQGIADYHPVILGSCSCNILVVGFESTSPFIFHHFPPCQAGPLFGGPVPFWLEQPFSNVTYQGIDQIACQSDRLTIRDTICCFFIKGGQIGDKP